MYINKIILKNFRSYKNLNLSVESQNIIISGENASGKTNLLMALAGFTHSLDIKELIFNDLNKYSSNDSNTYSNLETSILLKKSLDSICSNTLGLRVNKEDEGYKKTLFLDGKGMMLRRDISSIYRCMWLLPKTNHIFNESPSVRRKFFDRIVIEIYPQAKQLLRQLENLNKERLIVLNHNNSKWLSSLEEQISHVGTSIAIMRADVINLINSHVLELDEVRNRQTKFIPFVRSQHVCKVIDMVKNGLSSLAIEERYQKELYNNRNNDSQNFATKFGSHKMDFTVIDETGRLGHQCSMGEQRTMVLSFILSASLAVKSYTTESPILLIDEILSHLDNDLGKYIMELVVNLPCQTFITLLPNQLNLIKNINSMEQIQIKKKGLVSTATLGS